MEPPQPPLPTARNLPFQSLTGSQISVEMSESEVGLRLAVTLQNAGRLESAIVLAGGVKVPLLIVFASVMRTAGETSFERLSQDWARSALGMKALTRTM